MIHKAIASTPWYGWHTFTENSGQLFTGLEFVTGRFKRFCDTVAATQAHYIKALHAASIEATQLAQNFGQQMGTEKILVDV